MTVVCRRRALKMTMKYTSAFIVTASICDRTARPVVGPGHQSSFPKKTVFLNRPTSASPTRTRLRASSKRLSHRTSVSGTSCRFSKFKRAGQGNADWSIRLNSRYLRIVQPQLNSGDSPRSSTPSGGLLSAILVYLFDFPPCVITFPYAFMMRRQASVVSRSCKTRSCTEPPRPQVDNYSKRPGEA